MNNCRRKKEFLKNFCLLLKKIILSTFFVAYTWIFRLQVLWNIPSFLYQPCISLVIAKQTFYWIDSSLWWKDNMSLIIKDITITEMGSNKSFIYLTSADLGSRFCKFRRIPKVFFFLNIQFLYVHQILTYCQV